MAEGAVFAVLHPVRMQFLILGIGVISSLTLSTGQSNDFTRHGLFSLYNLGYYSSSDRMPAFSDGKS